MTSHIRPIGIALTVLASTAGAQNLPCTRQPPDTSSTNARLIGKDAHLFMDTTRRSGNLGPEAFGIFALDVPAFEETKWPDRPPVINLLGEPVVVGVTRTSLLKPGDVIEAIDDHPITTSVGSRQFTYPSPGVNTLSVRRGRDRVVLRFELAPPPPCTEWVTPPTDFGVQGRRAGNVNFGSEVGRGRARGSSDARQARDSAQGPIFVIDGVKIEPTAVPPSNRYGFAVTCRPSCAKVTMADGTSFYKFETTPAIIAVLANGPAAMAGVRPGDVIVKIEGLSILSDEAAIHLAQAEQKSPLRMTILRDGKELGIVLQAPR